MNYQRIYEQLTAKDMIADYTEKHHIIPQCIGGTNDPSNLVRLTPEAHYLAHQLLVKIYPDNHKLIFAANRMTSGKRRNNNLYGWLRNKHAEATSKLHKGKIVSAETRAKLSVANKGKPRPPISAETRAKLSVANKGKSFSETHRNNIRIANTGKKLSKETRDKIRNASQNKSPETIDKIRAASTGRVVSTETRAKLSAARKLRAPASAEQRAKTSASLKVIVICPYCNKEGGISAMYRWHFNNCKQNGLPGQT